MTTKTKARTTAAAAMHAADDDDDMFATMRIGLFLASGHPMVNFWALEPLHV